MKSLILPLFLIVLIGHLQAAPNETAIVGGESFEDLGFPPPGFDVVTSGLANTWERTEMRSNMGIASALMHFGPPGAFLDEWLILPQLDTTSFAGFVLAFSEAQFDWQFFGFEHGFYVSTTGREPEDFVPVLIETPGTHPMSDGWVDREIDLGDFVGFPQVHVAFRYQGNNADAWFIDDVLLFQPTQHDVGLVDLNIPEHPVFPAADVPVRMVAQNFGLEPAVFDFELEVLVNGAPVFVDMHSEPNLLPGETSTWETTFSPGVGDYHLIYSRLNPIQDEIPDNNQMNRTLSVFEAPRTSLGIFKSDANDPVNIQARTHLNSWLASENPDVSIINAHWLDAMYGENPVENEFMFNLHHPWTQAPDFHGDNTYDLDDFWNEGETGNWDLVGPRWNALYSESAAPLILEMNFNLTSPPNNGVVEVTVNIVNPLQPWIDHYLYVALTEDSVLGPIHNQTFRLLIPGLNGQLINQDKGVNIYNLNVGFADHWVIDNMHLVAWVIEGPYGEFGRVLNSKTLKITDPVSAVGQENLPTMTSLTGVSPNPFNPATKIAFSLAEEERARIAVYDVQGRIVAELADQVYPAGHHTVIWNGRGASGQTMPSGLYFARMKTGDTVTTRTMTLVK